MKVFPTSWSKLWSVLVSIKVSRLHPGAPGRSNVLNGPSSVRDPSYSRMGQEVQTFRVECVARHGPVSFLSKQGILEGPPSLYGPVVRVLWHVYPRNSSHLPKSCLSLVPQQCQFMYFLDVLKHFEFILRWLQWPFLCPYSRVNPSKSLVLWNFLRVNSFHGFGSSANIWSSQHCKNPNLFWYRYFTEVFYVVWDTYISL